MPVGAKENNDIGRSARKRSKQRHQNEQVNRAKEKQQRTAFSKRDTMHIPPPTQPKVPKRTLILLNFVVSYE